MAPVVLAGMTVVARESRDERRQGVILEDNATGQGDGVARLQVLLNLSVCVASTDCRCWKEGAGRPSGFALSGIQQGLQSCAEWWPLC